MNPRGSEYANLEGSLLGINLICDPGLRIFIRIVLEVHGVSLMRGNVIRSSSGDDLDNAQTLGRRQMRDGVGRCRRKESWGGKKK